MEETRFLLHELRLQNALELDGAKNLDAKASNITGYSVTFTVLFFGVGTFVMEKIQAPQQLILVLISFLLVGIILAILCVIFSVIAFRLRKYRYVMTYDNFFSVKEMPSDQQKWYDYFNENEIKSWITDFKTQENYEDFMIKEHLVALNRNTIANDLKAGWIKNAHLVFILAVCMIPVMLITILIGVGLRIVTIG